MLYFRDFEIGRSVGRCEIPADAAALCPGEVGAMRSDTLSRADLLALLMRGYCGIVTPRPPGNIHAGQSVRFLGNARFGDVLEMRIACVDKTEKNDRLWLCFEAGVHRRAAKVLEARMTFIWAA